MHQRRNIKQQKKSRLKTLLSLLLIFICSATLSAQTRIREKETYTGDTVRVHQTITKTDSTKYKMPDTKVNYDAEKLEKLFNPEMSDKERLKHKQAIQFFNDQIAADSTNLGAYVNRGTYFAELGLHVEAIKDYNKAISLDPKQAIPYYNRAISKARFMYTLDACKDLQKADELGFSQAGNLMAIKCGRYAVQLGLTTTTTSSK